MNRTNKAKTHILFKDLYGLLSTQFKWYKVLLNLVKDEREAIVNDDVEELIIITEEQEDIISTIKSLEDARKSLISKLDLQPNINLSDDELSLSQIAEFADMPYSSKFMKLRRRMKELLIEIRKINERNLQIVERSMDTFNTTIELLLSELSPSLTYSKSGKLEESDSVSESILRKLGYVSNYEA